MWCVSFEECEPWVPFFEAPFRLWSSLRPLIKYLIVTPVGAAGSSRLYNTNEPYPRPAWHPPVITKWENGSSFILLHLSGNCRPTHHLYCQQKNTKANTAAYNSTTKAPSPMPPEYPSRNSRLPCGTRASAPTSWGSGRAKSRWDAAQAWSTRRRTRCC
jgi:hypothetical protein